MTTQSAPIRRLLLATFAAALCGTIGVSASAAQPVQKAKHPAVERLNCVQFVKQSSPISLSGDAFAWWDHASGVYSRGSAPQEGAVMVFAKTHAMPHGHVAIVREQIDSRTLMIDHANWSRFAGHRGQVEREVRVIDVSKDNDWSKVRVWYHSLSDVGQTVYPLRGFVYSQAPAPSKPPAPLPRHHGH